ncbi:hypothetical protein ACWEOE_03160 [Amycolatopsis sp. NPDC004368]
MNDLDKLRSALHEEPEQPFAAPDLGRIITEGRRIRRRRRIVTGAGGAVAVVAVVGIVVGAVALRTPTEPQPVPVAAPPVASSSGPTTPTTPTTPSTLPTPPTYAPASDGKLPPAEPYGDVIHSGIETGGGELVFYVTKLDDVVLPGIHFSVLAAVQTKSGVRELYSSNEIRGSDTSFGFHATAGGMAAGDSYVPVFGYFAGPAVKITSTVRGKPVVANTARWSVNPDVVVFWFNPKEVPSSGVLTPLVAYGKDGTRLTK